MGKASQAAKDRYQEKIKEYKALISQALQNEAEQQKGLTKNDLTQNHGRVDLSEKSLNLVSYFVLMNALSVSLLNIRNESYLNEARKALYKSIIYLEEVVSPYLDVPFSEYEDGIESIETLDDHSRCRIIKKLGYSIRAVEDGFGSNSKWKWSFVELEGRFATVAKNLINLKTYIAGLDPRVEGYGVRIEHMNLVKDLLQKAADGYRQKYELSTRRIDDIQLAVNYLAALRRIYMLLGESENAEVAKRKIGIWKNKMELDIKESDLLDRSR